MLFQRYILPCLLLPILAMAGIGCTGTQQVIGELPSNSILACAPPASGSTAAVPPRPNNTPVRGTARVTPVVRQSTGAQAGVYAAWMPSAYDRPWRYIVIHHSSTDVGSAEIFDAAHRARGWDELGYHFVIDNGRGGSNGLVEVGSRWVKQKWGAHTGNTPGNDYNNFGIGICLVGDFSNHMPTQAQLENLRKLVFFLSDRYGIDPAHVVGHRDAPGANTECPGDALYHWVYSDLRPSLANHRGR